MSQKLKRIRQHTDAELDGAIVAAVRAFPLFYTVLHGVDAYMERRRRREERRKQAVEEALRRELDDAESREHMWGGS